MKTLFCPQIEVLENRIAPATFTVTSAADSGVGSLREALALAEASADLDTIAFDSVQTIYLATPLPNITHPVILNGKSAPGYSTAPQVVIDGSNAGFGDGLRFADTADGSQILGIAVTHFNNGGITILADDVLVSGVDSIANFIGLTVGGKNVVVGESTAGSGANVFSGNGLHGIYAEGAQNLTIQNAFVGTSDRTGSAQLGNSSGGMYFLDCDTVTVGGPAKSIITSNGGAGLRFSGVAGTVRVFSTVIGAFDGGVVSQASRNTGPGIVASGSADYFIGSNGGNIIVNNSDRGINVDGSGTTAIEGNLIGVTSVGGAISENLGGAIYAGGARMIIGGDGIASNTIAWTTAGGIVVPDPKPVEVRANTFRGTTLPPVDIFGGGATANDYPDVDTVQNYPALFGGYADAMGSYHIAGTLTSAVSTTYNVDFYGFSGTTYTHILKSTVTTDADGFVKFDVNTASLAGYTGVTATATSQTLKSTSETSPVAGIGPAVLFSDPMTVSVGEGNAGANLISFTVSLTSVPIANVVVTLEATAASTAFGTDFSFTPSTLNFNAGNLQQTITVAITGDTDVEPTELIRFGLVDISGSNAILIGSTKDIIITNDDTSLRVATDGKSATWRDVDGDLVTLKSTKAVLDPADFTLVAEGFYGGEELQSLNLGDDGAAAKGANLKLTAAFNKTGNFGDGSVHVGHINAAGIDLGSVTLPGDLGRITVGDVNLADGSIKSLTTHSVGLLGLSTQGAGGSLVSVFTGKAAKVAVKSDIVGAYLTSVGSGQNTAAGAFGAVTVGGDIIAQPALNAGFNAQGGIDSVKITGSIIGNATGLAAIIGGGKIGSVTVLGDIRGVGANPYNIAIYTKTTIGAVKAGSLTSAFIAAGGNANPTNAAAALAIASVTVRGTVSDALIQAGAVFGSNPDVQIGKITVGGDWIRSDALAGADKLYDIGAKIVVFAPAGASSGYSDNPLIVSKIASITIGGHIYGTAASGDGWGFSAGVIGKFVRGTTAYALRPNAIPNVPPTDSFVVSLTGDVFLREVV